MVGSTLSLTLALCASLLAASLALRTSLLESAQDLFVGALVSFVYETQLLFDLVHVDGGVARIVMAHWREVGAACELVQAQRSRYCDGT